MYLLDKEYKLKTVNERNEYVKLIKNVLSENRICNNIEYYEKHHIFPKSLYPEWKTKHKNIVYLTREEHILAHKLLKIIYPVKEMYFAYSFMTGITRRNLNHRELSKSLWNISEYRQKVTDKNKEYWSNNDILENHSKKLKEKLAEIYKNEPEKRYHAAYTTRQKVKNLETGIIFDTMKDAGKWANIKSYCHIGQVCRHERKYAGKTPTGENASWEYVGLSERSQHKNEYYEKCMQKTFQASNRKDTYKNKKELGWRGFKSKSVYCITTDEYFSNIKMAEEYYNISGISGVCNGKHLYAGKHPITNEKLIWEYKEKPEGRLFIK